MYITTTADRDRLAAWRVRGVSTLVTPPDGEPVDVETFALHINIANWEPELSILTLYLQAAREWVEAETQLACLTQTWDYTIDTVPWCGPSILIPMSPAISVVSLTSYDLLNAPTVVLSTTYFLDLSSRPARLTLNDGAVWPSGMRRTNALVLRYTAGHGTVPELVPARLRQAILFVAAELYRRREPTADVKVDELPYGLQAIIGHLKVYGPR